MTKKKVLIWGTGIDKLRDETAMVTGLTLQLSLWAETFKNNGWNVSTFISESTNRKDLDYIMFPKYRVGNIIIDPITCFFLIKRNRPHLIISRGAHRNLIWISLWSKFWGCKHVHMLASDSDLDFGNEIIDAPWDRKLYQIGMKFTKLFVVQNKLQANKLSVSFNNINYIQIPNIWPIAISTIDINRKTILWVSNFKKLKRPQWVFELAKALPNYNFIMVGGPEDKTFYDQCKKESLNISNLEFKGSLNLSNVNVLFSQAKIFLCTSTVEGFPNTFLQAWANKTPVLTSFDPSCIINDLNLGLVCKDINSFIEGIKKIENKKYYEEFQNSIVRYFNVNHDANRMYLKFISSFLK